MGLTCANPLMNLMAISPYALSRANGGDKKVAMAEIKMPTTMTGFAPYFLASHPPSTCVSMYPQ